MADDKPVLAPPPGVESNFDDPYSLAQLTIAVLSACLVLSAITTVLRFYAQFHVHKKWDWADLCILMSVGSHFAFDGILIAALPAGLGRHSWDVRERDHPHIQYLLYISYILYDPAVTFAKISILLQFLQIFAGTYRNRFWYAIVFLISINVLFYIPETFAIMFSCTPREKIWDQSVTGVCIDLSGLLTASGPFNVVTDFLIFILPIYAIWHLHIPVKKRIEVSCAFGVGLFGCLCSAVRIAYSARLGSTGDGTYVIAQNQMWANAEITVAIMIANSIILPRFVRSFKDAASERKKSAESGSASTLRNKISWRSKNSAGVQTRTLQEDLELNTPFPSGAKFSQLGRTNTEDMVTMDQDRDRVAPWFSSEPPDR